MEANLWRLPRILMAVGLWLLIVSILQPGSLASGTLAVLAYLYVISEKP